MDLQDGHPDEPNPPERRRERRPVSMRGHMVRDGGATHVIDLSDLNYGGCGIRSPVELKPGETVTLSVLGRGSIPAEVRWYKDGKAGLDFEPAIHASRKQVERRSLRVDVMAEIGLRVLGRNSYRTQAQDLSTDGCKVEVIERPSLGDTMSVKFDGLEVMEADVAWLEGHIAGLTFKNRMHPAVLDLLLRRIGAVPN